MLGKWSRPPARHLSVARASKLQVHPQRGPDPRRSGGTGANQMPTASRAGVGMVTLAAPAEVWSGYTTSLTTQSCAALTAQQAGWLELLADGRRNAIAIGAGGGESTHRYVLAARATKRATVLDADARTSFAEAPEDLFRAIEGPRVMTPHAGEFIRLFHFEGDKLERTRAAAAAAEFGLGLVAEDLPCILPRVLQKLKARADA